MEPQNENNFLKRYRVYIRQQKLKEALSDLNSALQLNPKNENILVSRGKLLLKMGKCAEAEQDFTSLKRCPFFFDSFAVVWSWRRAFLGSLYPNNKDISLKEDATRCRLAVREADFAYDRHLWAQARDNINEALRFAESSPTLFLRRAWCYFQMDEHYESISDTGKALKIESDNLEALELRGRSYYILGELETAMNHYRKGLKYDPEHKGIKDMYRIIKKIQDLQKKAAKATSSVSILHDKCYTRKPDLPKGRPW